MGSVPTVTQGAKDRPAARITMPWNRSVHRVGGLLTALVTLWMGVTGISMQVIDLHAILIHEPVTTPTGLSIAEGMYGPPDFAVIQPADFTAMALPANFDIQRGVQMVLKVAGAQGDRIGSLASAADVNDSGKRPPVGSDAIRPDTTINAEDVGDHIGSNGNLQPPPLTWVELRVSNGIPIGQVMLGTKLEAFDARTGTPVAAMPPVLLPQGRRLPPSMRQRLKALHRFWGSHDAPGVYFEFIVGLILWFLLLTGLTIYYQMLRVRFRQKNRSILWTSGGWWRGLHRVVSLVSAVFLICIAFSGTWIGFESSMGALRRVMSPVPAMPQAAGPAGQRHARRPNPTDFIIPLRYQEVEEMTSVTMDSINRLAPSAPIKVIRLRIYGQTKQGVVITGTAGQTDQLVFNADTGAPASLNEMGYPQSNFPFGTQVHENMKHFHSGAMFGVSGRLMNLFAGFSLTFLAVSGLWMYFGMWQKRRRVNRGNLVWR